MFQEMIEEAYNNPVTVEENAFEWNLAHAMFHLSLTQIHLSGAIGNLLKSKDPENQKAARTIYKAVQACSNIYQPAIQHLNYEKLMKDLSKTVNIITMVLDRQDHLGQIAGYLQREGNFKKRRRVKEKTTDPAP